MPKSTRTYKQEDLDAMLATIRNYATCTIRFIRPHAGGQPADDKGLAAFVQHCLGISPTITENPEGCAEAKEVPNPEFLRALGRIQNEEIGEEDVTPDEGEVHETAVYAVNCIRRSAAGPYILEHQVKAMLKQSASRLGLFRKKRGSKGDMAEFGVVEAAGDSLQDPERPWEIYLQRQAGDLASAANTWWVHLNGRVQTPQGPKSVDHHTEVCEEGATLCFRFGWPDNKKLTEKDIALIVAGSTIIGLGSCLSLGYGRFEVECLEFGGAS